jgi:hypothetical protein
MEHGFGKGDEEFLTVGFFPGRPIDELANSGEVFINGLFDFCGGAAEIYHLHIGLNDNRAIRICHDLPP